MYLGYFRIDFHWLTEVKPRPKHVQFACRHARALYEQCMTSFSGSHFHGSVVSKFFNSYHSGQKEVVPCIHVQTVRGLVQTLRLSSSPY